MDEARGGHEARLRMLEEQHVRLETMFSRLLPKIEAMIEGRSGDQERDSTLVRSTDRAHEKIRQMEGRLERMEKRQDKLHWMTLGALGALQVLIAVASWLFEHRAMLGH